MLLLIAQWLSVDVRAFSVFNYITLRAVMAAMTALLISFMLGPWMIRKLTAMKIGQAVQFRVNGYPQGDFTGQRRIG